ncbi:MAG: 1-acyl-sn-glycerol-3-phosphate acyltransferase [bacterium]
MLSALKNIFSFRYNDHPMGDFLYESHALWIRWFHDYYFRVRHAGAVEECMDLARLEHVILISNHALTVEATLINYFLLIHQAGKVGTLVFREAFKLPLIREFFRSCQCVPISIEKGAQTLKNRHILLFPEGMDFLKGLTQPDQMDHFHTGFLRMAKEYLKETGLKSVYVFPVAHAGIEKTLKLWIIQNEALLDTFIRPWAQYPFWAIPKWPLFLPTQVVINWGKPVRFTLKDLNSDRKLHAWAERLRQRIMHLRREAEEIRNHSPYSGFLGWIKTWFSNGKGLPSAIPEIPETPEAPTEEALVKPTVKRVLTPKVSSPLKKAAMAVKLPTPPKGLKKAAKRVPVTKALPPAKKASKAAMKSKATPVSSAPPKAFTRKTARPLVYSKLF